MTSSRDPGPPPRNVRRSIGHPSGRDTEGPRGNLSRKKELPQGCCAVWAASQVRRRTVCREPLDLLPDPVGPAGRIPQEGVDVRGPRPQVHVPRMGVHGVGHERAGFGARAGMSPLRPSTASPHPREPFGGPATAPPAALCSGPPSPWRVPTPPGQWRRSHHQRHHQPGPERARFPSRARRGPPRGCRRRGPGGELAATPNMKNGAGSATNPMGSKSAYTPSAVAAPNAHARSREGIEPRAAPRATRTASSARSRSRRELAQRLSSRSWASAHSRSSRRRRRPCRSRGMRHVSAGPQPNTSPLGAPPRASTLQRWALLISGGSGR